MVENEVKVYLKLKKSDRTVKYEIPQNITFKRLEQEAIQLVDAQKNIGWTFDYITSNVSGHNIHITEDIQIKNAINIIKSRTYEKKMVVFWINLGPVGT